MQPAAGTVGTMEHVGVGWRFLAMLIDGILLGFVFVVLSAMTGGASANDGQASANLSGGPFLLFLLIWQGYYIIMEALLGGTVGKLILGLRVVKDDGSPLDWGASIIRNLLRFIDGLFGYLVGAIFVWTSDEKKRLGDRAAGTFVTRRSELGATQPA